MDPTAPTAARTRRQFLRHAIAATAWPLPWHGTDALGSAAEGVAAGTGRAFRPAGNEFHFDTGALRGVLRSRGRSLGITPAVDGRTGVAIASDPGLLAPYRMLDAEHR